MAELRARRPIWRIRWAIVTVSSQPSVSSQTRTQGTEPEEPQGRTEGKASDLEDKVGYRLLYLVSVSSQTTRTQGTEPEEPQGRTEGKASDLEDKVGYSYCI